MKQRMLALAVLVVLVVVGCGGSGGSSNSNRTAPTPMAQTTSAAEVNKMVELLEENEALKARYVEERDDCGETTPIKEYRRVCAKPWAEKTMRRYSVDAALVNELMNEVGPGCRRALEGGNQYIPLDNRKVAVCSADVGQ